MWGTQTVPRGVLAENSEGPDLLDKKKLLAKMQARVHWNFTCNKQRYYTRIPAIEGIL